MAYTQQQYEELKAAIATGALTVRHNDRTVTYRNLDEMVRVQHLMEAELFPAPAASTDSPGRRFASFSKGY